MRAKNSHKVIKVSPIMAMGQEPDPTIFYNYCCFLRTELSC